MVRPTIATYSEQCVRLICAHGGPGDEVALQSPGGLLKTTALLKNVDVWTRRAQPSVVAPFAYRPTTLRIP